MILNRFVTTEGNILRFLINHTVNGEPYELSEDERYFVTFASEETPDTPIMSLSSPTNDIEVDFSHAPSKFPEGKYVFEVSLRNETASQVLMPALDEKHKPLNQLILLRRISKS